MRLFHRKPAPQVSSQVSPQASPPKGDFPTHADLCNDFLDQDALILLRILRQEVEAQRVRIVCRATLQDDDKSWWTVYVEVYRGEHPRDLTDYRWDLIDWCMHLGAEIYYDDAVERHRRMQLGRDAFDIGDDEAPSDIAS